MLLHHRQLLPFCLATGLAAQGADDARLLVALQKRGDSALQQVAETLRAEVQKLTAPPLTAVRDLAAATHPGGDVRQQRLSLHHGKRVQAADEARDTVVPATVAYVYGVGAIDPLDPATKPPNPKDKTAVEKCAAEQRRARALVVLRQGLLGLCPDADLALAGLQLRLDRDAGADHFAAFLHAWRNGPESFYEALDRTAGTKDSVFFYDAMLGDFRSSFVDAKAPGGDALKSLQGAHDALHEAFLSYRQYRGFREAVAYAVVLPPALPLPRRLARYEARVAGNYSLRQQIRLSLAATGHDLEALTTAITSRAKPLPQPIWSDTYDPYPTWIETFSALQPKMLEQAASTDELLAREETASAEAAQAIRELTLRLLREFTSH